MSTSFSNHSKYWTILYRQILNASNLVLGVLVFCAVNNSFIVANSRQHADNTSFKIQNIIVRVVSKKPATFGGLEVQVIYNHKLWLLQTKSFVEMGKKYRVSGNLKQFSLTIQSERFYLASGLEGKITASEIKMIGACDLVCIVLDHTYRLNTYIQQTLWQAGCTNMIIIVQNLTPLIHCNDVAVLLKGLVVGGSEGLSQSLQNGFRVLSLSHLVAVSGFQVVLISQTLEKLLQTLHTRRYLRVLLTVMGILCLLMLVGPEPPVLRSSISVIISMSVLAIFGRRVDSLRMLIFSGLSMLILNPLYLFSLSFQLSFAASAGVMFAGMLGVRSNYAILSFFEEGLTTTVYAFLFTLPIILTINSSISLLGILVNIIFLPIISWITISSILSVIPVVGLAFQAVSVTLASIMLYIVSLFQNPPRIQLSSFSAWEVTIYYFCIVLLTILIKSSLLNKKPGRNQVKETLTKSPSLFTYN